MLRIVPLTLLWVSVSCAGDDFYQFPYNVTRSTVSGIAAYRSALTLDWLAGEDARQRELAHAFETEGPPRPRARNTECIAYSRPASGKVARLMLELLKNLEGDEGVIIPGLMEALLRSKLLVETSALDAEPDLEALVRTPGVMMGEPHVTFPRTLAVAWTVAADPITTKKSGWCAIKKLSQYLVLARPADVAKQMRALEPVLARVRFIMEEFIQNVTPLNMYPEAMLPTPPPSKVKISKKKKQKPISRESRGEPEGGRSRLQDYGPEEPPPAHMLQGPLRSPDQAPPEPEPEPHQARLAPASRAVRPTSALTMCMMSVLLV